LATANRAPPMLAQVSSVVHGGQSSSPQARPNAAGSARGEMLSAPYSPLRLPEPIKTAVQRLCGAHRDVPCQFQKHSPPVARRVQTVSPKASPRRPQGGTIYGDVLVKDSSGWPATPSGSVFGRAGDRLAEPLPRPLRISQCRDRFHAFVAEALCGCDRNELSLVLWMSAATRLPSAAKRL
jgi:hypothetical protein